MIEVEIEKKLTKQQAQKYLYSKGYFPSFDSIKIEQKERLVFVDFPIQKKETYFIIKFYNTQNNLF